jgi:hypothetical protein
MTCAYCGQPAEDNFSIHRDGFGVGPEVSLCDTCGSGPTPTAWEIWERIAQPAQGRFAHLNVKEAQRRLARRQTKAR